MTEVPTWLPEKEVPPDVAGLLTLRQAQIAGCIATGMTNPEIAARLGLKVQTVRNYVSGIFTITGTTDRYQLEIQMANGTLRLPDSPE